MNSKITFKKLLLGSALLLAAEGAWVSSVYAGLSLPEQKAVLATFKAVMGRDANSAESQKLFHEVEKQKPKGAPALATLITQTFKSGAPAPTATVVKVAAQPMPQPPKPVAHTAVVAVAKPVAPLVPKPVSPAVQKIAERELVVALKGHEKEIVAVGLSPDVIKQAIENPDSLKFEELPHTLEEAHAQIKSLQGFVHGMLHIMHNLYVERQQDIADIMHTHDEALIARMEEKDRAVQAELQAMKHLIEPILKAFKPGEGRFIREQVEELAAPPPAVRRGGPPPPPLPGLEPGAAPRVQKPAVQPAKPIPVVKISPAYAADPIGTLKADIAELLKEVKAGNWPMSVSRVQAINRAVEPLIQRLKAVGSMEYFQSPYGQTVHDHAGQHILNILNLCSGILMKANAENSAPSRPVLQAMEDILTAIQGMNFPASDTEADRGIGTTVRAVTELERNRVDIRDLQRRAIQQGIGLRKVPDHLKKDASAPKF